MALAEMKTFGFNVVTALAIVVVPSRREFKIVARYFVFQRLSPTPAPAKWMIASTPSSAARSIVPAAGSH